MSSTIRRVLFLVLLGVWLRGVLLAQTPQPSSPATTVSELKLDTGKEIFEAACLGCHGPGGRGQPQTTLGFEPPATFPDFSDCNGSTRERISDWRATIHEGGPGRGFSDIMPSFAEALTLERIDRLTGYLRTLCTEPGWSLGELNLPRALLTEKAFPEDETVVTMAANANGADGFRARSFMKSGSAPAASWKSWRPSTSPRKRKAAGPAVSATSPSATSASSPIAREPDRLQAS